MADNVTLPGTGSLVATDDDGTAQVQWVKLKYGANGAFTAVDATNPLPVTLISGGDGSVQGVDAHDAAVTADPVLGGGYASAAAPTGVSADGDAVRAWHLRNGAAATVLTAAGALIGGDATNGLDVDVTHVVPGTAAADLGKAEDAVHASADVGVMALAVRRDTPSAGAADGDYCALSVDATGLLRTIESSSLVDNAGFTDGTSRVLPGGYIFDEVAGTALTENDVVAARVDTKRAQVFTLEDATTRGQRLAVSSAGAAMVAGVVAHDAAVSGNPILIGLEARTTDGTAVASGDLTRATCDTLGKQVVLQGSTHDQQVNGTTNYTTNTGADVIAAVASTRVAVTSILVTNAHATVSTKVTIRDGTTAKVVGYAAAIGGGFCLQAGGRPLFITTANTAVTAICGTTGADVDVSISGYKILN